MTRWPRSESSSPSRAGSRPSYGTAMSGLRAGIACALIPFCAILARSASAQSPAAPPRSVFESGVPGPRVLLVALPVASWEDLRARHLPTVDRLAAEGGVGLMSVPGSRAGGLGATWVSLSTGAPAAGARVVPDVTEVDGRRQVTPEVARAANEGSGTGARPGMLGERLQGLGLTTGACAVFGESGAAALALADRRGMVDGFRTLDGEDPAAVRAALREMLLQYATLLLDLSAAPSLSAADAVLGDAVDLLPSPHLVVAFAPTGARPEKPWALGPVIAVESGRGAAAGLLTSASTRRDGLITAADMAATVLAWWTGSASLRGGMRGRPARVVASGRPLDRLDALEAMLLARRETRPWAGGIYAGCGMVLALLGLSWAIRSRRWRFPPASGIAFALAPVALMVTPFLARSAFLQLLGAAALAGVLGVGAARLRSGRAALGAAMVSGSALIAGDVLTGSHLMLRSPFGFSVISGSRYYGIGNEYLGVLAAMAPVGLAAAAARRPAAGLPAVCAAVAVVVLVGAPWWGANWGGCVALAAGFAAVWAVAARMGGARAAAVVLMAVFVGAVLPAGLDLLRPAAERSHIGAAAAALASGDPGMLADIGARKLHMNWSLLSGARPWVPLALLPLVCFWAMLGPSGPARQALRTLPHVNAGLIGAFCAAVVALLLNDSGVVSAALAGAVLLGVVVFLGARGAEGAR